MKATIHIITVIVLGLFLTTTTFAQVKPNKLEAFTFKLNGRINYYNFKWETDPEKRNVMDTENLNMYLLYNFNDNILFKSEIEIEHGGTGTTMELDKFEEFGEYEMEVEAGGEVKLEQLNILFIQKKWFNIRIGRVKLYMGNASKLDESTKHKTAQLSPLENNLLPLGWYENGLEILGNINKFSYKAFLVNGLSSTGFSSANWIKRGHQGRFETLNSNNLAFSSRIDYNLKNGYIGFSLYHGNTNENRPKPDLDNTNTFVSIIDLHAHIAKENWSFTSMGLYGNLQNAEAVSIANMNLSNLLNEKRTPVASNVLGYYFECSYNILKDLAPKTIKKLFVFGRYDYYDSMYKTKGNVFDNPRWERKLTSIGLNYFITPDIVLKSQYGINKLGIGLTEQTIILGMGFNIL